MPLQEIVRPIGKADTDAETPTTMPELPEKQKKLVDTYFPSESFTANNTV